MPCCHVVDPWTNKWRQPWTRCMSYLGAKFSKSSLEESLQKWTPGNMDVVDTNVSFHIKINKSLMGSSYGYKMANDITFVHYLQNKPRHAVVTVWSSLLDKVVVVLKCLACVARDPLFKLLLHSYDIRKRLSLSAKSQYKWNNSKLMQKS